MGEHIRPSRVGIRELRQNLSVYVERVKEGETLEVTEHGHPVARLAPIPAAHVSAYERMVADGRLVPATGQLLDAQPVELGAGPSLTEVLIEMRDEDAR